MRAHWKTGTRNLLMSSALFCFTVLSGTACKIMKLEACLKAIDCSGGLRWFSSSSCGINSQHLVADLDAHVSGHDLLMKMVM